MSLDLINVIPFSKGSALVNYCEIKTIKDMGQLDVGFERDIERGHVGRQEPGAVVGRDSCRITERKAADRR